MLVCTNIAHLKCIEGILELYGVFNNVGPLKRKKR